MSTITPYNKTTGLEYQGYNINFLVMAGFKSPEWATFLQWKKAGYKVKKGSKGTHARTFVTVDKKKKTDSGIAPRHFVLFNTEQVELVPVEKAPEALNNSCLDNKY